MNLPNHLPFPSSCCQTVTALSSLDPFVFPPDSLSSTILAHQNAHASSFSTALGPPQLTACQYSPTIRILCAKEIVNKRAVSFSALEISQKLLTDHSTYFAALMAGPWKEAKACVLRLPDIRVEDFKRLHLVLLAGAAAARNNIGKPTATVANLTETYILADYFNMTQVQGWLKAALADYLAENRGWASVYVNELLDQVAAANGAEQMHKDKVDDFSNAYLRLKKLVPEQQIMEPVQLVRYLVTHCPRPLMASVISTLDKEFKDDVFSTYLLL